MEPEKLCTKDCRQKYEKKTFVKVHANVGIFNLCMCGMIDLFWKIMDDFANAFATLVAISNDFSFGVSLVTLIVYDAAIRCDRV